MSEPRTNLEIWRDALELLQEREFYDGYNHDRAQSYVSCETCGAVKYHRTSDEEHNPAHNPGCHLASTLRELAARDDGGVYLFASERGGPLTRWAFAKMLSRAGRLAGLAFAVHPHMLRHGAGYKLANDGADTRSIQVFLGHRSIQCTTRYTEIASERLKGLWKD